MNWWIIEDALRDNKGHWFEYLRTFRQGLEKQGDQLRLFASSECGCETASSLSAEALLPQSIWARMSDGAPKWKKSGRIVAHGTATWYRVSRLLRRESEKPDIIFVPTVLVHHLLGWYLLLSWSLRAQTAKVLLFFPNTPAFIDDDGIPHWNQDPSAKLFAFLIRRCRKWVAQGKLILGAETKPMVATMSQLTGVPFQYLPHPVEPMAIGKSHLEKDGQIIRFGAYGSARHEKGSELIQEAIRQYLADKPDPRVRFSLQWISDFGLPDGGTATLDRDLASHPQCEIINGYFPEGYYEKQIAGTDVMLLPYRKAYRLRVSRVVIEAMQAGMPVITSKGTTLHQQAHAHGVAIDCEQDDAESLLSAIREAIKHLPQLQADAAQCANASHKHFSVRHFRSILMTGKDNDSAVALII